MSLGRAERIEKILSSYCELSITRMRSYSLQAPSLLKHKVHVSLVKGDSKIIMAAQYFNM